MIAMSNHETGIEEINKSSGDVTEEDLKRGGDLFEKFWLRPKNYTDQRVAIRLRINKKWGGWKLRDELVNALGLEVGDTITTEITPCFTSDLIDDDNDTDLFASGEGADWLLDHHVTAGTIIDCYVRFSYARVPLGMHDKEIGKVSLVFEKGIRVVGTDDRRGTAISDNPMSLELLLENLMPRE